MRVLAIAAVLCFFPAPVTASCIVGAPPSYEDITYVSVSQYSMVGQLHPQFQYEAVSIPGTQNRKTRVQASLEATRGVKFTGNFIATDPLRSFHDVIATLKQHHFFDLRLNPAMKLYIDGPEDRITVVRCGVTTTLGTASSGGEVDLDDLQGRAFVDLERDVRDVIFAERWTLPTPTPN